jgi:predicted negative regulator of RcsB-dependent stress response
VLNSHHLSDEEKAEALKRWWSDNGKSIIGGIVIGLALVFGWRGWLDYQQQQAAVASSEYDSLLEAAALGTLDQAGAKLESLKKDYAGTAYDYFASLEMARLAVDNKDLPAAKNYLEYAAANADQDGLKQLATLRLARVLMAMGENNQAKALVSAGVEGAFAGEYAHILGDILRTEGDRVGALAAYDKALNQNGTNVALIEMKINQVR